ncbi:flagellar biosynthesis protein FlgI, partial [Achromobacter xylosoxidans]|nr:flagellar biosynthesis protein FlgI [Achromobacter xylosoxidans]
MKSPAPTSFLARAHRAALRLGIAHGLAALALLGAMAPAHALRIKEVAAVQGVRSNQL